MSTWSCLYKLDMSGCRNLKEFPNVPESIVELVLCSTWIEEIPPRIENLSLLSKLIMYGCKKLKTISPNISKLKNLEFLGLRIYGFSEHDVIDQYRPDLFEAIIEWGPDLKRRWRLRSDFDIHDIFPICLPEKALTSPISLRFNSNGLKTIPDCIGRLSGLSKLDVSHCVHLVALPQLPGSLLSIDAQGCVLLKIIDSSFQNPNICLNFAYCSHLNQKARNLIQTSACKYAFLPGEEVPAHFTHRDSSGSLTINLNLTPLPSSLRFKACILLSDDDDDEEGGNSLRGMSCHVRGKQNGHTVQYVLDQPHTPNLDVYEKHLYIFEDSFSLNQDCLEAGETTFNELSFLFVVHGTTRKVKGCGVRLLEVPHCTLDRNVDNDGEGSDCFNLNQKAKELIQTSACKYAVLPGEEVPAHFTHQATSGCLTINMTPRSLPSSFRFKACILLSGNSDDDNEECVPWLIRELFDNYEEDENLLMRVSCRGEQNGLTVSYGSNMRHMNQDLYGYEDHLYTFEDSFCLDQDFPEAEETTFSKLVFQFQVFYKNWRVKGCGVRLLEVPHCILDGKESENEVLWAP